MNTCECGCGTAIQSDRRFALHHHLKRKNQPRGSFGKGSDHFDWNGGRYVGNYVYVSMPGHPRANAKGYVREHILIAEAALGKPLPPGALVHHWDRDGTNNAHANLLICPNQAYHKIIHARMKALETCGHADWKYCVYCKTYDDESRLSKSRRPNRVMPMYYHKKCNTELHRAYLQKRSEEAQKSEVRK